MRIKSVAVQNVGGLVDQTVRFPDSPVVALAGPNGTGKTRLLAAIVGFWSNHIPASQVDQTATIAVSVDLAADERRTLASFGKEMGWFQTDWPDQVPPQVVLRLSGSSFRGVVRESAPAMPCLTEFPNNAVVLQRRPSLDPMYLPAERRLMPVQGIGIDLALLAEAVAQQKNAESRSAIQNYGRLDDQEFEQFAKALCIAGRLENEPGEAAPEGASRVTWETFLQSVNAMIFPKKLLPLTTQNPENLRIQLPSGDIHAVPDLSSGERQALIILSRALRAGMSGKIMLIDEPDAFLHPTLSQRLIEALIDGVGEDGQLIIATHSPAILDRIPPSSIIRLDHEHESRVVADQDGLIELYRDTGFKASSLTQSELLVVTEGELDEVVLKKLFPQMSQVSVTQAQGRSGVTTRVGNLIDYKVPVIGIVDHDVEPPMLSRAVVDHICVLPTADMEGVFLSDDTALQVMIDIGAIKPEFQSLEALRNVRDSLYAEKRDAVIAEHAKNSLRNKFNLKWPSARAEEPLNLLRSFSANAALPGAADVDSAIAAGEEFWEEHAENPWRIVRGKYILGEFNTKVSNFTGGPRLLEAVAGQRPQLAALAEFAERLRSLVS